MKKEILTSVGRKNSFELLFQPASSLTLMVVCSLKKVSIFFVISEKEIGGGPTGSTGGTRRRLPYLSIPPLAS
jgi:hypothetical protein